MSSTNPYCTALDIEVPRLEDVKDEPEANTYALLIVVLLERGEPVTLADAAARFEEAGVAPADRALASLKRCRPGRPPIFRDGDLYSLDPHHHEVDLWAFRLGLRPPSVPALRIVRPSPEPLGSPEEPLTVAELDDAWRDGVPGGWSAQRTAICVLDAHGRAMQPAEVVAFVAARTTWSRLSTGSASRWRRGAPVQAQDDGSWALDREHDAVRSARQAARERAATSRRWADVRPDPAVLEATRKRFEREREANAQRLAQMRRVVVHAFPAEAPAAVVLVDVGRHEITTCMGDAVAEAAARLEEYDIIAAVNVRGLVRALGFDPGTRRLGELGPPQRTTRLNRRGRTLAITTSLLVQGSCNISRPFGDPDTLRGYLRDGQTTKLRRRLEADAKSLYALYQYGRLHGALRLRWGFLDERLPAPWVHPDEHTLYRLMMRALESDAPLEVVLGTAPGWKDPWARARTARVRMEEGGWRPWLVDEDGFAIDEADVQLARLA